MLSHHPKQIHLCFFIKKSDITIFVLIYVDDIIVTNSSDHAINAFLQDANKDFTIKDFGVLPYFLGIEVKKTSAGLVLTQGKYASELLEKVDMLKLNSAPTPLSSTDPLSLVAGYPLGSEDSTQYRNIVGGLPAWFYHHVRSYGKWKPIPLVFILEIMKLDIKY
jgi:hypothetical protein